MVNFLEQLQRFLSATPETLTRAYPTVDPEKLLAGLNTGGQGLKPGGEMFAGAPIPDAGLLRQLPGAPTVEGQGFKMPVENPWTPQNPAEWSAPWLANVGGPGLRVGPAAPTAAPPPVATPTSWMIPSDARALMQSAQPVQQPRAPAAPELPRGGGRPADMRIAMPPLQKLQQDMLRNILQRSIYG